MLPAWFQPWLTPIVLLRAACPTNPSASAPSSGPKKAWPAPAMNTRGFTTHHPEGSSGSKPKPAPTTREAPARSARRCRTQSTMKPAGVCIRHTPKPDSASAVPMASSRQPRSARNLARKGMTTPPTSARKKFAAFSPTRLWSETQGHEELGLRWPDRA